MSRVLYFSGVRRKELVTFVVGDVLWDQRSIFVRAGKGDKDRYVLLDVTTLQLLKAWIGSAPTDRRVFPLSIYWGENNFKPLCEAGSTKNFSGIEAGQERATGLQNCNWPIMNHQNFRVLVIEDDPQLLGIIESLLADEGYLVEAAESGERAIEVCRDQRFDLIVADIRMPGIDGLDTLEHLRANDPSLQSLVMTGYASEEDPIRGGGHRCEGGCRAGGGAGGLARFICRLERGGGRRVVPFNVRHRDGRVDAGPAWNHAACD